MTDHARWVRAGLVVAAAVLLGAILLAQRSSRVTVVETAPSTTVPTTVPRSPAATAPATTPAHDPAQVKVLVLNAVDAKKAIAGPAAQALMVAGFSNSTGRNAAANVATTAVYFVPGYQTDATLVANALHFPPTTVQSLPSPLPSDVGNPQDANVVVLVGADSAPPNG